MHKHLAARVLIIESFIITEIIGIIQIPNKKVRNHGTNPIIYYFPIWKCCKVYLLT